MLLRRICLAPLGCGMVSAKNIAFLRARGARYLVGTPKSQLRQFEAALLEKEGWSEVQSGLEAKLVAHPDGAGEEQFGSPAHRPP